MSDPRPPGETRPEDVFFDARLTPHRSLGAGGFAVLMVCVCAVTCTAGLVCFAVGAWPVAGFLGLDAALIYAAFRINYRRACAYQTLRLTRGGLTVEHVDHWGRRRSWTLQPYWLQVLIDDRPEENSPLTLRSHGKSVAVGQFLSLEERLDLAEALRRALAAARRAMPGDCRPEPV